MTVVIPLVEAAEFDSTACCMGKALLTDKDADMIDASACVTEKYKVAGAEALFGYHIANCGKIACGAWQNHAEVFLIKIEHKP